MPHDYKTAIGDSGLSIYDDVREAHPQLWIPSEILGPMLRTALPGVSLDGLPLRTRSKKVKTLICEALGYPVPASFRKTQPRFRGQDFDTYVQKSNNLQIWNEDISPTRRYVIIGVSDLDLITHVHVATGDVIARWDTTGTLTQKYQARFTPGSADRELVSPVDSPNLMTLLSAAAQLRRSDPSAGPDAGQLLPIDVVFSRLTTLIGQTFQDAGSDQERNRGAALHRLACLALGYEAYTDNGQFPDVRHQLLEIKLQTSPTIDLGLVSPDSDERLDLPAVAQTFVRHWDVRYAIVGGIVAGGRVTIAHVLVTTGADFYGRFPQFGGKVVNKKLQIPLPASVIGR